MLIYHIIIKIFYILYNLYNSKDYILSHTFIFFFNYVIYFKNFNIICNYKKRKIRKILFLIIFCSYIFSVNF